MGKNLQQLWDQISCAQEGKAVLGRRAFSKMLILKPLSARTYSVADKLRQHRVKAHTFIHTCSTSACRADVGLSVELAVELRSSEISKKHFVLHTSEFLIDEV